MWNTRLLTLSTFAGLVIAVAFTTSIPMYADGSLKRVVAKTLEAKSDGLPAGSVLMRYQAAGADKAGTDEIAEVDRYIREEVPMAIGFPADAYASTMSIRSAAITPVDPAKSDAGRRRQMTMTAWSDLAAHVEMIGGKLPSDQAPAGSPVEAAILEETMFRSDIHIGDVYTYPLAGTSKSAPIQVKIVGTFKIKDEGDPYWFQGQEGLLASLFVSDKLFRNELLGNRKIALNLANWYYAFNLKEIQTSQIPRLQKTLTRLDMNLYAKLKETRVDISFQPMLQEFKKISLQLQLLLFTLAAPMLAMVLFYIVINARQSLDRQRGDIAVLRSRGGSTRQIIWIYLLEGCILGGAALIAGPLIGWFMAKSIGASDGFLTFVDRTSMPIRLTSEAMLYGCAAVILAIASSVIPAVLSARSSIVSYKRQLARSDRRPVWERWFLDVALLGLVAYGWYLFSANRMLSLQTGLTTDELQMQPLLFFVPALSIAAFGLVFLRLFPWLLRLAGWIFKAFLPVPFYLTLTQLSRSARSYYPLMLLLTLTLGLGIYNSSAARTIDINSTERTLYKYGSDVVVQTVWEGVSDELPKDNAAGQPGGTGQGGAGGPSGGGQGNPGGPGKGSGGQPGAPGGQDETAPVKLRFIEPPFEVFRSLEGVDHAARVLKTKGDVAASGKSLGRGMVMGIDNTDFAKVAWFRSDLFPVHPYHYLNLLGSYEQAVIIPSNFAEKYQLKSGDLLTITLQSQPVEFVIVGILPYWPSQYPDESPFFITNLDYVYDQVGVIQYEVWLKMKEGAKVAPMLETLRQNHVEWSDVQDVRSLLVTEKKHPTRGGVFGILSLGFLVSVLISLIGYVLYWFFNLSGRAVQFGILRAMGLGRRQLTLMLLTEQLLTAGLSIVLGIGLGKLTGRLFLPFLQTADNVKTEVPPFRVIFESRDAYPLYAVIAIMMLTGVAMLAMHIRRLRVHQAVKLGEER